MIKPVSMRHRDRAMYRRQIRSGDGGGVVFVGLYFPLAGIGPVEHAVVPISCVRPLAKRGLSGMK